VRCVPLAALTLTLIGASLLHVVLEAAQEYLVLGPDTKCRYPNIRRWKAADKHAITIDEIA
jgi:hypothetical protein